MNRSETENHSPTGYLQYLNGSKSAGPSQTSGVTTLVTDTSHLADLGELYRSPVSPSDVSSPSLADSDDDEDSSSDDSPGPTLQMMGENQVRKSRASQRHLGLRVPATARPRLFSDPPARAPDNEDAFDPSPETIQNEHQTSLPVQVAPANIPWSPAMAFLTGFSSPFAGPCSLGSSAASPAPIQNQGPVEEKVGPYVLGPVIGHGGFSVVRKGTSASGIVAVKIIPVPAQQDAKSSLENEISIWSSLHHEYVLPLFADYRKDNNIYLVSLYCPAGSLFDILRLHGAPGLPQDDVSTMFRQIVRGLRYLHEQVRLVHGDIKLENVLVDELGACRIADFGLSRYITTAISRTPSESDVPKNLLPPHLRGRASHHRNSTHVPGLNKQSSLHHFPPGSLPYAAPELLLPPTSSSKPPVDDENSSNSYPANPAQDVWALGCLLHALLFGRLPFADSYEPRLQMKIVRGAWERGHSRTRSRSRARGSKSRSVSRIRSSSRETRIGAGFQRNSTPRMASNSRSDDVKIGKQARRVLRGCICVDVGRRWTVAQIDEVNFIPCIRSGRLTKWLS
jgi:serine/threonine protein kinase